MIEWAFIICYFNSWTTVQPTYYTWCSGSKFLFANTVTEVVLHVCNIHFQLLHNTLMGLYWIKSQNKMWMYFVLLQPKTICNIYKHEHNYSIDDIT